MTCRILIASLLLTLIGRAPSYAQDRPQRMAADDLAIDVNTRWPGGQQGGYFPIRIQILNKGETRDLTLRFEPDKNQRLPRVDLRIEATQNAPGRFVLRVPLVGRGSQGKLQVLDERGREIEGLERTIRLPNLNQGNLYPGLPGIISISETDVPTREFAAGVSAVNQPTAMGSPYYRYRPSGSGSKVEVFRVSPAELPDVWIDYTTVDLALIELRELEDLPPAKRKPLMQWVQCGGTLIVYNSSDEAARGLRAAVEKTLEFENRGAVGVRWQPANINKRNEARSAVQQAESVQTSRYGASSRGRPRRPGTPPKTKTTVKRTTPRFNWPKSSQAFYRRDLALGSIIAIPGNPFDGTRYDWAWLLKAVPAQSYQWATRHGFSPRQDSEHFVQFLIPGVKGVPVYAFLFLITAFTILIGPLNYFLMWKRKRLFLLVLTIPIVAFVTSLGLFAYSALSHGFEVKSRTRSVTILDQRTKEAVSVSRVAMFAGFAPSDGLEFSNNTAVYPIWPIDKHFENGYVDWTEGQQLKSGWLPSRTRTQYLAVAHRRERGRLEIERKSANQLEVSNGFEANLKGLLVVDDDGTAYYAGQLAAGGTAALPKATQTDRQTINRLLVENRPEVPEGITPPRRSRRILGMRIRTRYNRHQTSPQYSSSLIEQKLLGLQTLLTRGSSLPPRTYIAIFEGAPNIDIGVKGTSSAKDFHVVLGHY